MSPNTLLRPRFAALIDCRAKERFQYHKFWRQRINIEMTRLKKTLHSCFLLPTNRLCFSIFLTSFLLFSPGAQADKAALVVNALDNKMSVAHLPAAEAFKLLMDKPSIVVLDVRTPAEFQQVRIAGAVNIDFYAKNFIERLNGLDKQKQYLLHCRSGARSGRALGIMKDLGFTTVLHLQGGMNDWQRYKLPTQP